MQRMIPTLARIAGAGLLLAALHASAIAQDADPWAKDEAWLCKPGRQDLCAEPVTRATLDAQGNVAREVLRPNPAAPVDCFYIYPTISLDPNGNSSLVPGPGERRAVASQLAMFSSVCRPFAPMYRQVTLAGLRAVMQGNPGAANADMAYADVAAAWRHYLEVDNQGRGVVLIGHSQGTRMLMQLIQREIEGKPAQARIVSALLPGLNVEVAQGSDKGGAFTTLPLCAAKADVGCVVAYVTFRATVPPPENARFGRSRTPGKEVACVDPVRLSGVPLSSFLLTKSNLLGGEAAPKAWTDMRDKLDTAYVNLSGLASVACVKDGATHYLAMTLAPQAEDKRPADIPADIVVQGRVWDDWGLHLVDINLVAGNLMEIVRNQAVAWQAKAGK